MYYERLYQVYEMARSLSLPLRYLTNFSKFAHENSLNPFLETPWGRRLSASLDATERMTRRYAKPDFNLEKTKVNGKTVPISESVVWEKPFCALRHFERPDSALTKEQSKLLIVAPMSGHYATLLRGTVETFLPSYDVYITDWTDARTVNLTEGNFDLDDYIDYLIEILNFLGDDVSVLAVCQPSVPVLAAVSILEANHAPTPPTAMILMGGPIDTRKSPTPVNAFVKNHSLEWFEKNCIHRVPFPNPGMMRRVYPGFLQLSGFMAMNIDKHIYAHWQMFSDLVEGDGDSAEKNKRFYDEYLSVCDLTAEFYLQTVRVVFQEHALPEGLFLHRNQLIAPAAIRRTALMTVEGEHDDISGIGQTRAAHALCSNLSSERQLYHFQPKVGHYGVFNGSRFRNEIAPKIDAFIQAMRRSFSVSGFNQQ